MRRFLIRHRDDQRETFIPLDHEPGQRIEADFGEIAVDFPDGRRKVNVLILVWSYSNAPFAIALQSVTVKGYVDHVEIVHQNTVVARHPRSYEHGDQVLDPLHYLITLGRRPAALNHSNVYRQWTLPAVFEELRERLEERLEERHGARAGVRSARESNKPSFRWRRTWTATTSRRCRR